MSGCGPESDGRPRVRAPSGEGAFGATDRSARLAGVVPSPLGGPTHAGWYESWRDSHTPETRGRDSAEFTHDMRGVTGRRSGSTRGGWPWLRRRGARARRQRASRGGGRPRGGARHRADRSCRQQPQSRVGQGLQPDRGLATKPEISWAAAIPRSVIEARGDDRVNRVVWRGAPSRLRRDGVAALTRKTAANRTKWKTPEGTSITRCSGHCKQRPDH